MTNQTMNLNSFWARKQPALHVGGVVMGIAVIFLALPALAAIPTIPFTVTLSENVTVPACTNPNCPRIQLNVDGHTDRYAYCAPATNTATLTCTYTATAGDLDLNGIGIQSTNLDLPGGSSVTDQRGNPMTNLAFTAPANMASVFVNYPSLSMDFTNGAAGRYTLNGTVYNDLTSFLGAGAANGTFTRASSGTYFDSSGIMQSAGNNVARLDHDPTSPFAAKGILIEEGRTNLFTYSSQIDDATWGKINILGFGGGSTINATLAPDGTASAELLTPSASTGVFAVSQLVTISGTAHTATFYVKPNGYTQLGFREGSVTGVYATFDCTGAGSVITTSGTTASIESLSGGWYRARVTYTGPAATHNFGFFIMSGYTSGSPHSHSWTANGTSGMYFWGAQLETGSFPTSYIPTTTTSASRQADNLNFPIGSWFLSGSGAQTATFYVPSYAVNSNRVVGYTGDGCALCLTANKQVWWDGNLLSTANSIIANSTNKTASTYTTTNNSTVLNGGSVVSGATGSTPISSATTFYIGRGSNGANYLNGHIQNLKHYPSTPSNTQLQLLTQ